MKGALGGAVASIALAAAGAAGQPERAAPVTFSKDVAPILFSRCATCHRPDGVAPFSLLTYAQARQRATLIAEVTARRFMPPWKADPDDGPFIGQHPLDDDEIARIRRWVDGGAVEGDPRDLPLLPQWTAGWQLGRPDLIVSPAQPYTLRADGTDVFRVFVIPLPVESVRFVKGLEFQPGNARVVHHANIRVDPTPASRRFQEEDPGPGAEGLIALSAEYPDGHFLGWTPGQVAPLLPRGLAWRLAPGTDLVVELHLQPSGKPEVVRPTLGLFFGDDPPDRTPMMIRLGRQSIDIPAGEPRYAIADSFVLPVDVEVQAVQPHAHYRAREVTGLATLPDGTTRRLIHIKEWDFRWQHVYRYVTPFELPKGTTLTMQITYDNSADNPRNPDRPPRRVVFGQRSSDEMGDLWIQVLTRNAHDFGVLRAAFEPKMLAEDLIGFRRELERAPDNVHLHNKLATLNLRLGHTEEGVTHFAAVARLDPESAAAHFNLGTALTVARRLEEASRALRRALAIRPHYGVAHNNLGGVLLATGKAAEALGHFREAVRLDPANIEARVNLAEAYAATGQFDRALQTAEAALETQPSEPLAATLRQALARYQRLVPRKP